MPNPSCRRILIAEDEGLIALQLEQILATLDFTVVGPVSAVKDVLAALDTDAFDGALLDVNLRGHSIFPVLPRLTERNKPFIITSGYHAQSLFPPAYRDVPRASKPVDEGLLRELCLTTFA